MRRPESASGLQKGFGMKSLRVGLLAVAVLVGCGEGVPAAEGGQDQATVEKALLPACYDANCPNSGEPKQPPEPTGLPQDPIPIHTGRTQHQLGSSGELTRVR